MYLQVLQLSLAQTDGEPGAVIEPETVGTAVEDVFSFVQALPIEAHAATGILLLVGLGLWLFGGRIVKPLFGLTGIVLGGLVGMIALPAVGSDSIFGYPSSLVGAGIGAIIGLVFALMALRLAIVVAASLGLAAAGFMGATVYLSFNPLPDDSPPPAFVIDDAERSFNGRLLFDNPVTGEKMTLEQLTRSLRETDSFLGLGSVRDAAEGEAATELRQRFEVIAVRCEAIVREGYDLAKSHWNALSMRERMLVMGSTFGGFAFGLAVGFFMPKRSTAFITALVGSAIWLTSAGLLIEAFVPSMRTATDQPPAVWASIWAFTILLGLVIQLMGLGGSAPEKKKKKSEKKDDEKKDDADSEKDGD